MERKDALFLQQDILRAKQLLLLLPLPQQVPKTKVWRLQIGATKKMNQSPADWATTGAGNLHIQPAKGLHAAGGAGTSRATAQVEAAP